VNGANFLRKWDENSWNLVQETAGVRRKGADRLGLFAVIRGSGARVDMIVCVARIGSIRIIKLIERRKRKGSAGKRGICN
jgi:hypothetical protein